jgi:hypothetical protein
MTMLPFLPEQIEQWPLARLKPYERNPRLHSDDQVAKVAASIASYGWTVPLLVTEDGEVIAGHGRLLAARHLGLTKVPVIGCRISVPSRCGRTASPTTSWFSQVPGTTNCWRPSCTR